MVIGAGGVDLIVTTPKGRRIGVDIASWLTRPQMAAFTDRVGRLEAARADKIIDEAWLFVRRPTIDLRRESEAQARNVRLVSVDELPQLLAGDAGRAE